MRITLSLGVSGSYPEPADAKLTPVIISSMLRVESKYGGKFSFTPTCEAVPYTTKPNQSHFTFINKQTKANDFEGNKKDIFPS